MEARSMAMEILTQSFVEKVQCPLNRQKIDYFDIGRRGLLLEVRISGGKTYCLRYTDHHGKFRQLRFANALDITLQDARTLAEETRRKIALGIDPREERIERKNSPLFSTFIDEKFIPFIKSYKRSWKTDISLLNNHVLPALGRLYMDEIRRDHILQLHTGVKNRGAQASTCNRILILVKFIFNQALKWEIAGLKKNPAKDVSFFKDNNSKDRYLSQDETKRLFEALAQSENTMLKYIIPMLVLTGSRKREVLDATWQEFDVERRQWRISMSKSGRARHVPLSDGVLALLDTIPRFAYCKYVFPNPATLKPYQNIYRTWHRARTDAGIEDVRIHDLRHNFASLLVNHGRSLYEVQQILGHSQVRTTQRYAHLANETLVAAANVASIAVDGFTSKEDSVEEEEQERTLVQQSLINKVKQTSASTIKPPTYSPWVMLA